MKTFFNIVSGVKDVAALGAGAAAGVAFAGLIAATASVGGVFAVLSGVGAAYVLAVVIDAVADALESETLKVFARGFLAGGLGSAFGVSYTGPGSEFLPTMK